MQAIILAGQRDGEDPLTGYTGASCKALVEIDGIPMLFRVLDTLESASLIDQIHLSGPAHEKVQQHPALRSLVEEARVQWSAPENSPSTSAYGVLEKLPEDEGVMLTTADHPFLTSEMVDFFCRESQALGVDLVIGLAPYRLVEKEFPDMRKTLLKFSEGDFCGCNLFAFTSKSGRDAASFWRQLEARRKKPVYIIRFLGLSVLLRYFLGILSLDKALAIFGKRLGIKIGYVNMPFGRAAVDVDSVEDFLLVQSYFKSTQETKS